MPEQKNRYVTHSIADPPICEECQKQELSFFDPSCSGCSDMLTNGETCIPEIFAIIRQWVPQVQQNLATFVNEIIKRGAGINDRDGLTDMTLLHYACKSGAVGVGDIDAATALTTELVSQGADVSLRCRWTDMLPLHYAAFFNSASVIKVLLKTSGGKDIDATCSEFDNGAVLHIAVSNLCLDAAKCLLQHGANAFIKDGKNRTPLNTIPEVSDVDRDSSSAVIANKLRRLLSEAELTSGSESGMESATDSGVNLLDILDLRIGDKVMVGDSKVGILRYCGRTDFAKGQWAGVELHEPVGKNNGSVAGRSYFECKSKHGIFCPLSKISKHSTKSSPRQRSRPNSAKLQSSLSSRPLRQRSQHTAGGSLPGSRSSSRSSSPQPRSKDEANDKADKHEIGDRVVIRGEEERKGVVKFVGETRFANGVWFGVELDGPCGKNDGSVNGERYFDSKPKHGIFLHPSKLIRENHQDLTSSSSSSSELKVLKPDNTSDLHNSKLSYGGSNPDLSKPRSFLRPVSRQLSNSVPDLRKKKHNRQQELHLSGIPKFKRPSTKKDFSETKPVLKELKELSATLYLGYSSELLREDKGVHIYVNNEVSVLRFIGETHFGSGVWLGVELSKPVGKNDGSVNGERYFTCKPNCGLFVRPNRATHHGIKCSKLLDR